MKNINFKDVRDFLFIYLLILILLMISISPILMMLTMNIVLPTLCQSSFPCRTTQYELESLLFIDFICSNMIIFFFFLDALDSPKRRRIA